MKCFLDEETPLFCISQRRGREGKKSLSIIVNSNDVEKEFEMISRYVNNQKDAGASGFQVLWTRKYCKRTIMAIVYGIAMPMCGITAVNFYSKKIVMGGNNPNPTPEQEFEANMYSLFIALEGPIAPFLAVPLMK